MASAVAMAFWWRPASCNRRARLSSCSARLRRLLASLGSVVTSRFPLGGPVRKIHQRCTEAAQHDVVLFAAGEILQSGAVAFARQSANIHLQAVLAHSRAGFILTPAENLGDFRIRCESVENRGAGWAGDQQIDVAYSLSSAPDAARA